MMLNFSKPKDVRIDPRTAVLGLVAAVSSASLGFFLNTVTTDIFSLKFEALSAAIPLILSLFLGIPIILLFVLLERRALLRRAVFLLSAVLFSAALSGIPVFWQAVSGLIFLFGLLWFDSFSHNIVKAFTFFGARIFMAPLRNMFLVTLLVLGILVYFSSSSSLVSPDDRITIPENVLDPAAEVLVDQVLLAIQKEAGLEQFSEDEIIKMLKEQGALELFENEFGISLDESKINTKEDLKESVKLSLRQRMEPELQKMVGGYVKFLPIVASIATVLSLTFLSPFAMWGLALVFALVYRAALLAGIAKIETIKEEVKRFVPA